MSAVAMDSVRHHGNISSQQATSLLKTLLVLVAFLAILVLVF